MMASTDGIYSVINKAKSLAKKRAYSWESRPCKKIDFYSR
jgi:hypothetical protein